MSASNLLGSPGPSLSCEADGHCITCGDDGVPMVVLRVDQQRELALCEDEHGEHHTVEIALVDPCRRGSRLLVHAGTAIASLDGAAI